MREDESVNVKLPVQLKWKVSIFMTLLIASVC